MGEFEYKDYVFENVIPAAESIMRYDGSDLSSAEDEPEKLDMRHAPKNALLIDCVPNPELCIPYAPPLLDMASCSTYSQAPFDIPLRDKTRRRYGIMARKGAGSPKNTDRTHADMAFVAPPARDVVIWDNIEPLALFEIIHECLDPSGPGPRFVVVDLEGGVVIKDPRPEAMLRTRPIRPKMLPDRMTIAWRMKLHDWLLEWSGRVPAKAQALIEEMSLIYAFDTNGGDTFSPYWRYYGSNIVKARRLMSLRNTSLPGRLRADLSDEYAMINRGLRFETRLADAFASDTTDALRIGA